ncbi:MAG: DNA repair protein RadC [Candidatus Ozemobacter sibiricus]|jgi:DNA repair protein RadC|uniref:DNA repair protein RadC n=1 Tax=Candidatus Ozemobacter sibiricus TaxID=2268124 RepID=A0A367ZUR1_9BACT|nr:MAG: DNA repair protein RadC [Candidatus Ozemobacter sibiricus]
MSPRPPASDLLAGHRERLRARFDEAGLDAFADHEILELLLFYALPRIDTKPIAKTLLAELGGLPEVFAAPPERLADIPGLGPGAIRFIRLLSAVTGKILQKKAFGTTPVIAQASDLVAYLTGIMANLPIEEFRVIYLDNANRILKDEALSVGTETQTAVYPKVVMKRALTLHATGLLVAHNHPSGALRPSPADLELTRNLEAAARALDLRFLDHVILGRGGFGYFSFREHGLLL